MIIFPQPIVSVGAAPWTYRIWGGQPATQPGQTRCWSNINNKEIYLQRIKTKSSGLCKTNADGHFCISILVIRKYAVLRSACQGHCWLIRLERSMKHLFVYKYLFALLSRAKLNPLLSHICCHVSRMVVSLFGSRTLTKDLRKFVIAVHKPRRVLLIEDK